MQASHCDEERTERTFYGISEENDGYNPSMLPLSHLPLACLCYPEEKTSLCKD